MALPLSSFLERIKPAPQQFAIHQPMYFRVRAFCGKKGIWSLSIFPTRLLR